MSVSALAEAYEELKELRRKGAPEASIQGELESLANGEAVPFANKLSAEQFGRFLEIKTVADRVFGDDAKADAWLQRTNPSLSGQRPVDLLVDELGAAVVREMLERIDHGIFA